MHHATATAQEAPMTTIQQSVSDGIYLAPGLYTNPITVNPGIDVSGNYFGIGAGSESGAWNITNSGTIADAGIYGSAISLYAGGSVTNLGVGIIGSAVANTGGIYITGGTGAVTNYGFTGGVWLSAGGSVTNHQGGRIVSDTNSGYGVGLYAGGTITNAGLISGRFVGVDASHAGGTIINQTGGTLTGNYGGALLGLAGAPGTGGGNLTNQAGALIVGDSGVYAGVSPATIVNAGTIRGTFAGTIVQQFTIVVGPGVSLGAGGSVTNDVSGVITSVGYGVNVAVAGGTVVNAGSIGGTVGAVRFAADSGGRLVVDPGATFGGTVNGGSPPGVGTATTLELAAGAPSVLGDLGVNYLNFGAIDFDPGAVWFVAGTPGGLTGTISGFAVHDTIEVLGITATGSTYAGGVLTLTTGQGLNTLDLPGSFATGNFVVTSAGGNTDVSLACFRQGSAILTPDGEVPVEALRPGDHVLADTGDGILAPRPLVWVGHRTLDCRRHPNPRDVLPIRVAPGAFGPGQPHRPLDLSPDHAVHVDGVLIPIRYLVNGTTIAQVEAETLTYFHIELDRHAVLRAEGLPAESYLDTGNRAAFANGGRTVMLHPEFALQVWRRDACADLVLDGPQLEAARSLVLDRAEALGYCLTADPALELLVDGQPLQPHVAGRTWTLVLPPGRGTLRLRSRTWVPTQSTDAEDDTRTLGVAIAALRLDGRALSLDDPRLSAGWHTAEPGWRWTNGEAELRIEGARYLDFALVMAGRYWQRPAEDASEFRYTA